MRAMIVAVGVCLGTAGFAQTETPTLDESIALFERGNYREAREQLSLLVTAGGAPEGRKAEARVYLAASSHALGDEALAYGQLLQLHREIPEVKIDPLLFLPAFLELNRRAEQEIAKERAAKTEPVVVTPPEVERPVGPPGQKPALSLHAGARVFGDVAGVRAVGGVVDALAGYGSFEGGARLVIGPSPAPGVELAWAPSMGRVKPRVGARATYVPGLGAAGVGGLAGVRYALSPSVSAVADVGVERFFGLPPRYQELAITVTAGVAYDVFGTTGGTK